MTLLSSNGLVDDQQRWTGANATLVVTGDLIDKGPKGLEVIDLLRTLQTSAATTGGNVVVTLGNHEAELFADPNNDKASSGSGTDVRGRWLRDLPFGARVGDWLFAHAGNTHGQGLTDLANTLELWQPH